MVLENVFTALFVFEWLLRIAANSWAWMFSPMNAFDTIVVWITGVLVTWILVPMKIDASRFRRIAALRVLRLGRLIRTIRVFPEFRELWVLVHGTIGCGPLLFWALVIMFVIHYCFAIFFVE